MAIYINGVLQGEPEAPTFEVKSVSKATKTRVYVNGVLKSIDGVLVSMKAAE
jgi:hypothetical protein